MSRNRKFRRINMSVWETGFLLGFTRIMKNNFVLGEQDILRLRGAVFY